MNQTSEVSPHAAGFLNRLTQKSIFLLDAAGAGLSATATLAVMLTLSEWTGLSWRLWLSLIGIALVYGAFSFTCYYWIHQIRSWMLGLMIVANLLYCLLTISIVFFFSDIKITGQVYLLAEALVIAVVVWIEVSVYRRIFRS